LQMCLILQIGRDLERCGGSFLCVGMVGAVRGAAAADRPASIDLAGDQHQIVVRGRQLRAHAILAVALAATVLFSLGGGRRYTVERYVCRPGQSFIELDGQIEVINLPRCTWEQKRERAHDRAVAGAAAAGLGMLGLLVLRRARQRVIANSAGLAIRNLVRTRQVAWTDAAGLVVLERSRGQLPVMGVMTRLGTVRMAATESRTRDGAVTTFDGLARFARAAGVPVAADAIDLLVGAPRRRHMGVRRSADRVVVGWPLQVACSFVVWPPAAVAIEAFGLGDDADADGVSARGWIGVAAVVALALLLQVRIARMGLIVDHGGVSIRRLLHTRRIAWRDVDAISADTA
jgi:hypothetical protein